jgi:hypothetical protein
MKNILIIPDSECPALVIDLSMTLIGISISTVLHCEIVEDNFTTFTLIMYVVWLFSGFRILASA